MKKFILVLCTTLLTMSYSYGQLDWNQDEETSLSVFIDPTFTDSGFQGGLTLIKELYWGWASLEMSTYLGGEVPYWDLVGQGGLVLSSRVTGRHNIYFGARIGRIDREGNAYPLIGAITAYDIAVSREISVGVRLWLDHREDLDPQFYGGHSNNNLIFTDSNQLRENGAVYIRLLL